MFKITKLAASFFVLFIFSLSFSQNKTIDSLKLTWQHSKEHDTTKLFSIVVTMSTKYNDSDERYHHLNHFLGRQAWEHLQRKSSPAIHEKYVQFLAYYYATLMVEYRQKGEISKALAAIDKGIALNKSVGLHQDVHFAMIDKANLYAYIKEYEKAIHYAFIGLKYFEAHPENVGDNGIIMANATLGDIYKSQKKWKKAIECYQIVIATLQAKTTYYVQNDYYLLTTYASCATIYDDLENYPEALAYLNKSLFLAKKIKDNKWTSIVLSKIAGVKIKQSKLDEADVLLKQALALSNDELAVANAYVRSGELQYARNNFKRADTFLTKGLSLSMKLKRMELQELAAELLFKTSKADKNFEKALEMHLFQDKLEDSSKMEAAKNKMAQQQLQYDFEKKELNYKLDTEKKTAEKNRLLIVLSGILLLLLLGGYFYYRNNKQKQAIAVLEKTQIKQKLLITQMNPHFIFNSIENIRSLIHDKQNDDAVNYLGKFSRLTRQILENSNENYISLAEEVEMIENYLAIQQLLYNNKFNFSIAIEDAIDTESTFLPPMLTQPFIENAIKHGLSNKSQNGEIDIRFYHKDGKLFFEVSDNGKGFDASKKTDNHKSLAMAITKERLVTYTKNQDFVVQTNNITDNDQNVVGAKVAFEIPFIFEG